MRYAIISDLHANRQAFRAVLSDIESAGADQILCLGDIVGYGPSPAEVLALAYRHVHHFVLGNHDAVIARTLDAGCFNDGARASIEWTARQLDAKARRFFADLPLVLQGENFRCVHGEFADPPAFNYLIADVDALASWATAPKEKVLFCGHTHVPGLFVIGESGCPHQLPPQDFCLEAGKRYIVNTGSVGQPRDGGTRASWVLFDSVTGGVFFRKTPFDVDGYRADLAAAGLPAPAGFLDVAEKRRLPPLREQLDFRPLRRAADAPKPEYRIERLEAALRRAHRSARRWRLTGFLALLLVMLAAAVVTWTAPRALRPPPPPPSVTYAALEPLAESVAAVAERNLLEAPDGAGAVSAANRLRRWSVTVANPKTQRVEIREESAGDGADGKYGKNGRTGTSGTDKAEKAAGTDRIPGAANAAGGGTVFVLESGTAKPMAVLSATIPAEKGARFSASAQFRTDGMGGGWFELALLQRLPDGTERLLENKGVKADRSGRWATVRFTLGKTARLAQAGQLRLVLRGEFTGRVLARRCALVRCE